MKVVIAGSRTISDYFEVVKAIDDSKFSISEVVSGGAPGVDRLGEQYATKHFIPIERFPANWGMFGKNAGFIRNEQMAQYGDALIAVWDGYSRGTQHMITCIQREGKPVFIHVVN